MITQVSDAGTRGLCRYWGGGGGRSRSLKFYTVTHDLLRSVTVTPGVSVLEAGGGGGAEV